MENETRPGLTATQMLIGVILLIAAVAGGYYLGLQRGTDTSTPTPAPTSTQTPTEESSTAPASKSEPGASETSDWLTYRHVAGFTVKYPATWTVGSKEGDVTLQFPEDRGWEPDVIMMVVAAPGMSLTEWAAANTKADEQAEGPESTLLGSNAGVVVVNGHPALFGSGRTHGSGTLTSYAFKVGDSVVQLDYGYLEGILEHEALFRSQAETIISTFNIVE